MKECELISVITRFPYRTRFYLETYKNEKPLLDDEVYLNYEDVEVYRGLISKDFIDENDFKSKPDQSAFSDEYIIKRHDKDPGFRIEWFGVSVNENIDEMKCSLKFPNRHIKGIAKGLMKSKHGPADFKKEKTHHNWYIFEKEEKNVIDSFEVLNV